MNSTQNLFLPQLTNMHRKTFCFHHVPDSTLSQTCISQKSDTQKTIIKQKNWVFSNTANKLANMHRKTFYFPHVPDSFKIVHGPEHVSVKSLADTQKTVITFFCVGSIQDDQTQLFQICMPINQRKKNLLL